MRCTTDLADAAAMIDLFERAAEALRGSDRREGSSVRLPGRGRLLATGDLHDNPEHFRKIVHLARLEESPDHHVILHEIIHGEMLVNGVDLSHRMLARAAELVTRHPGQAHVVLGNHELAQMTGQRVSKGAGDNVQLFDDGLAFAFGDDWEDVAAAINGFVRAMPLAVRTASGVLCAHSVPGSGRLDRFDPGVLDRELVDDDYRAGEGSAWLMVWGRGASEAELDELAAGWGVSLFCLGHEHVANGIALRGPRTILLNSDHEFGTVAPIDLGAPPVAEEILQGAIRLRAIPAPA